MPDIFDFCADTANLVINNEEKLRYVLVFVWVAGVLGNLVNLAVFGHKRMISPVNRILWWLSISDLLELVSIAAYVHGCGWCTYVDLFYPDFGTRSSYYGTKVLHFSFFLLQTFHMTAVGLNIALAFWRYLAVAYPLRANIQCSHRSVRLTVALLYVLSFLSSLPVLFAFAVEEDYYVNDGTGVPRLSKTPNYVLQPTFEDDDNNHYIIYCVILRIVPYIALIIVSCMLILAVIRTDRKRQKIVASATDTKQKQINLITKVIMVILLMFLITEIPMGLSGILWILIKMDNDISNYVPSCENMVSRFQQLTLLINASYNIFCYLILSTQYKETLRLLFVDKFDFVRFSKLEPTVTQSLNNTELDEM